MRAFRASGWRLVVGAALAACLPSCTPFALKPDPECTAPCPEEAKVCKEPTVRALAHDLDHLEKHIDWYGSVVAKVPDVWGQARLTQYREEFEKEMASELDDFKFTLNGSLARSDQAYFANALALSMAAQPKPPVIGRNVGAKPTEAPVLVPTAKDTTTVDKQTSKDGDLTKETTTTTLVKEAVAPAAPAPAATTPLAPLSVPAPKDLLSDPDKVIQRTEKVELKKQGIAGGAITIEPTLSLAQKARYLDYLNQLRRTNEGDDKADAPGYSLNLMRIPVSLLPGKRTDVGFGAEITFTVDPILGDDLLPMTFRNMVTNDLRQQLGFPLAQMLGDAEVVGLLKNEVRLVVEGMSLLQMWVAGEAPITEDLIKSVSLIDRLRLAAAADNLLDGTPLGKDPKIEELAKSVQYVVEEFRHRRTLPGFGCASPMPAGYATRADLPQAPAPAGAKDSATPPARGTRQLRPQAQEMSIFATPSAAPAIRKLMEKIQLPAPSFANGIENKIAYPTSQIFDVIGPSFSFEIAFGAWLAFEDIIKRQKYAHLPDIQSYLREETRAAYQFLAQPTHQHLWDRFCTPELVAAIRSRQVARLQDLREEFRCEVARLTLTDTYRRSRPANEWMHLSRTAALAWCVLVDSALLNDRLIRDMKEAASSRGERLPHCGEWLPYYLPNPSPEARESFNAYVRLRWPIYVFALDPATQDQNLADTLSTRREMQLALAIAFTNGFINANKMTRYTRRLEAEYETIALNRTQVGFAHGENVFGWRFYPRFQTPDTESNTTVLFRDMFIGGPSRDALLRQRRLEPGPRECVAIVVMPSFVPHVTVDAVANWFPLTNPKHKVLDHTEAMRLSRTVKTLQRCEHQVSDADCYRDGDLHRLQKRVEQLASRLPTQTMTLPVPVLNTLGGFEMFSNGTTDLSPELYGWYGAPGVRADKETTLFLVGDHFSPLRSRVIVGNQVVPGDKQKLLSRQVMQVTVPSGVLGLRDPGTKLLYATAHIATPYGVTRELLIPIEEPAKPAETATPKPGFNVPADKLVIRYGMKGVGPGLFVPMFKGVVNPDLKLTWVEPIGGPIASEVDLQLKVSFRGGNFTVPCKGVVRGVATGGGQVVLARSSLDALGSDLLAQIATQNPLPLDGNPLAAGLTTTEVVVTQAADKLGGLVAKTTPTNNQLSIEFRAEGHCECEAAPAAPRPMMDPVPKNPTPEKPELLPAPKGAASRP